jgi:hypothetical protein
LGRHAALERARERSAELNARAEALKMAQRRLEKLAAEGRISAKVQTILRARHDYRLGRLPKLFRTGSTPTPPRRPRSSGRI